MQSDFSLVKEGDIGEEGGWRRERRSIKSYKAR
jgi:hypothetical protein